MLFNILLVHIFSTQFYHKFFVLHFFTNRFIGFIVVNSGYYCSLLEVTDKSRSTTSVTKLLQELEVKGVVSLVCLKMMN